MFFTQNKDGGRSMKPTRKELVKFFLSNDARTRSSERNVLTKKILKTIRKEAPSRYWGHYGAISAVLALVILPMVPIFLDIENTDVVLVSYLVLAIMFLAIPVIGYTGYKVFETYFEKYPEDFPRNEAE